MVLNASSWRAAITVEKGKGPVLWKATAII